MKIATSLSQLGLASFLSQHNLIVKDKYIIDSPDQGLSNYLSGKLTDITDANPIFEYEVSPHETKDGTPKRISLDSYGFFNWADIDDEVR